MKTLREYLEEQLKDELFKQEYLKVKKELEEEEMNAKKDN